VPRRLKGINQQVSSIPELLPYFKGLLIVDTKFEYEWEGNPISTRPVKKHFVRIVMDLRVPSSGLPGCTRSGNLHGQA
jgi:hypothetical protein